MSATARAISVLRISLVVLVAFGVLNSLQVLAEEPEAVKGAGENGLQERLAEALKLPSAFDKWMVDCLYKERFDELESMADLLRKDGGDFDGGESKVRHFYAKASFTTYIESLVGNQPQARLDNWRKALAKSKTPLLAASQYHIQQAWKARGTGFAGGITEEGWMAFRDNMEKSRDLLAEAEKLPGNDPDLYAQQIEVAKCLSWPREETDKIVEKLLKNSPHYYPAHQAMAEYLLPRWHGEEGDMEAYAAKVADTIGGDEGAKVYARIASRVSRYYPSIHFFRVTKFEYPRIRQGLAAILKEQPESAEHLNEACFFAVLNVDFETARTHFSTLEKLGDPWTARLWGLESQYSASKKSVQAAPAVRGEERLLIPAHWRASVDVVFTSDGKQLISSGGRSEICVWDPATGKLVGQHVELGQLPLSSGWFSSNGQHFAAQLRAADRGVNTGQSTLPLLLLDLSGREGPRRLDVLGVDLATVTFSTDNRLLVAGPYKGRMEIHRLDKPDPSMTIEVPNSRGSPRLSPDGKTVFVAVFDQPLQKDKVAAWDTATGAQLELKLPLFKTGFTNLYVSADGNMLYVCGSGFTIIWDVKKEELVKQIDHPMVKLGGARETFFANSKLLAFPAQTEVILWDLETGTELHRFGPHVSFANSIAFSPDGTTLAVGDSTGTIKLWDVAKYTKR